MSIQTAKYQSSSMELMTVQSSNLESSLRRSGSQVSEQQLSNRESLQSSDMQLWHSASWSINLSSSLDNFSVPNTLDGK